MHPSAYDNLAQVQDCLWWHVARRRLVETVLRDITLPQGSVALDLGCGTGGNLPFISGLASQIYGLDLSMHALHTARRKHPTAKLVCGDASRLADYFPPETFDLVTSFNVLYHKWVRDDRDVVRQIKTVLKPGGIAVFNEPAYPCLRRGLDRVAMGTRRYRRSTLRSYADGAGLEWVRGTYFNAVCLPAAFGLSLLARLSTDDGVTTVARETHLPPAPINGLMKLALAAERVLIRAAGSIPFGLSVMFVARKPLPSEPRPSGSGFTRPRQSAGITVRRKTKSPIRHTSHPQRTER